MSNEFETPNDETNQDQQDQIQQEQAVAQMISDNSPMAKFSEKVSALEAEMAKVIVGQKEMLKLLIAGLLAGGHVLIEGAPGVAKTLTAKLMAHSIDVPFSRIQFTPDMMPSDVLGTSVFNPKDTNFEFKAGPIFSNIILIDEINRAPAKTQAALFEVMEERQVTVDGVTRKMQEPFMVIATQNPIEQEGTYRLPEAQLDRFLFKVIVPYPSLEEEVLILEGHNALNSKQMTDAISKVLNGNEIKELRAQINGMYSGDNILKYIANIVTETRNHKSIYLGGSPRASIGILTASKAIAAIRGRNFITPDDVKYVALPVLRHRLVLTPEKEMEGTLVDDIVTGIINSIEVPR